MSRAAFIVEGVKFKALLTNGDLPRSYLNTNIFSVPEKITALPYKLPKLLEGVRN
jgi:hypothetical protein